MANLLCDNAILIAEKQQHAQGWHLACSVPRRMPRLFCIDF